MNKPLIDTLKLTTDTFPAIPLQPHGKRPTLDEWQHSKARSTVDLNAHVSTGGNLGLVIGERHLIMDIDPRNGGGESFKQLRNDHPSFDILYTPTVLTAGKGAHFYFVLPATDDLSQQWSIKKSLKQYPGIDWLHGNRYVVAPGSTNGTGQWSWHKDATFPPQEISTDDLVALFPPDDKSHMVEDSGPLWGIITPGELEQLLDLINPTDYRDHDGWFQLMSSAHHATAGEGKNEFVEWSISDPSYSDAGSLTEYRWDTLTADGPSDSPITIRTLTAALKTATPLWLRTRLGQAEPFTPIDTTPSAPDSKAILKEALAEHQAVIAATDDPVDLATEVWPQVATDSRLTETTRDLLCRAIAKKGGLSVRALKQDLPTMAPSPNRPTDDLSQEQGHLRVAEAVLNDLGGLSRCCFHAGDFWSFDKTHWQRVTDHQVRHAIQAKARDEEYNVIVTGSALASIYAVLASLMPQTAEDHFNPSSDGVMINTLDGALTLTQSGAWTLQPHKPEHRMNYIIPRRYHPDDLPSPVYDAFIHRATDGDAEAIRTIEVFAVYSSVSRTPWLRKAVFLHGATGSGKSVVLHLIETIVGRQNRSAIDLEDFSKDFSLAQIAGKLINVAGEIDSSRQVAAAKFNQIIGGDSIQIDQKYKAPITITNSAVLWFSGNHYPRLKDSSGAAQDRVALISIPNTIPLGDRDPDMRAKLDMEADAVFNKALKVFAEEYLKDGCRSICTTPQRSRQKMVEWAQQMQPMQAWADERLKLDAGDEQFISTQELYKDYQYWARETGHQATNSTRFGRLITQHLGESVRVRMDGLNRRGHQGVALHPVNTAFENILS